MCIRLSTTTTVEWNRIKNKIQSYCLLLLDAFNWRGNVLIYDHLGNETIVNNSNDSSFKECDDFVEFYGQ